MQRIYASARTVLSISSTFCPGNGLSISVLPNSSTDEAFTPWGRRARRNRACLSHFQIDFPFPPRDAPTLAPRWAAMLAWLLNRASGGRDRATVRMELCEISCIRWDDP